MNEKALESFINMCDEMLVPTQEGFISMIKKWKERKSKINKKLEFDSLESKRIKEELSELGDPEGNKKLEVMEKMQKACIAYLKKYIKNPDFVKKYKDYLYLINIIPEDYGNPYSVQICDVQDGIDFDRWREWDSKHKNEYDSEKDRENANPYSNNDWYNELLDAGEKYLEETFKKELSAYKIYIGTGDGDECNIYID